MHRYGASRPWSVVALATAAAAGVVALTGGISSAFEDPAAVTPVVLSKARPAPARAAAAAPPVAALASGTWRIQVGAYAHPQAAAAHVRNLADRVPDLSTLRFEPEPWGQLTRARLAGVVDEAEARRLCARLIAAGSGCFVVPAG